MNLSMLIFDHDSNEMDADALTYNNTLMKKLYSMEFIKHVHEKMEGPFYRMIESDPHLESTVDPLSTDNLNYILKDLTEDIMKEIYPVEDDDRMKTNVVNIDLRNSLQTDSDYSLIDCTFRDLFICAILINYVSVAKVLLALVAHKILKRYRDKYTTYSDKRVAYTQLMNYFQDYAIDCIDLCFKSDPTIAHGLVIRELMLFGNLMCFQVVKSSFSRLRRYIY